MAFTRVSLSTIVDRIKSDFETRITGATSLLRRSFLAVTSRVNAGAFHLMYEYLDYQAKQLFASTADEAGLETHGDEWGKTRNAAVAATGSGTATGVNGTNIPADTQLQSTDGNVYSTDALVVVAGGIAVLAFTADVAGSASNDDPSITLTFVSPIVGVDTDFTVDTDGIINGADEETDDDYRTRILQRKRQPPFGGAETDYIQWMLEVSGVTRAWALPLYQGAGTIGCAFVRDDDVSIIPDPGEIATVRSYLISHTDPGSGLTVGMPVTALPGLTMITLSPLTITFIIKIRPDTADVRAAIEANLDDLFLRDAGPNQAIRLSKIREAVSLATGELDSVLISPSNDVTASSTQIQNRGGVTWETLNE